MAAQAIQATATAVFQVDMAALLIQEVVAEAQAFVARGKYWKPK